MDMKELEGISESQYEKFLNSGIFWEWFPEATGDYEKDTKKRKCTEKEKL